MRAAPFPGLTRAQIAAAVELIYGWEGDGPRARIAPGHTVDGFTAAATRVLEVARGGGRLAFATARPAALLQLYRRFAARAAAEGAEVLAGVESSGIGPAGRRVRWIDQVAVLTDGAALLADDAVEAAEEWLFTLARPDLVVADHTYAGVASSSGLEVVAFADLDAVALAVAAWQGRALRIVPLDDRRPPGAVRRSARSPRDARGRPAGPLRCGPYARRNRLVAALLQQEPQGPTLTPRRSGGNGRGEPVAQSFATARFLTVQEVADLMRVSTMTVYRIIKSGELPAVRVGRSFRVRDVDVDTYLGNRYTQAG